MAGIVSIQNVKILQKRYSFDEWSNGQTKDGIALTLDTGELGFDLTNLVLKIGTAYGQNWGSAHEIGAPNIVNKYKVNTDYTTEVPADESNYVVSKVEETQNSSGSVLTFYYDKVTISDADVLQYVDDNTTTATKGGVVVVADISKNSTNGHKLTETKVEVATPDQVDAKVKVVADKLANHKTNFTVDGDGQFITGIKSQSTTSDGTHNVVFNTGDIVIEDQTATGNVTASGTSGKTVEYVKSVTLSTDTYGKHTLAGTTDSFTIPTSTGSVGEHSDTSTKTVTSVSLNDHQLSGTSKSITSGSTEVSITGTSSEIKVAVDLSKYAKIIDIPSVMVFQGVIVGGTISAPYDLSAGTIKTGNTYKVGKTGYFIDSTHGIHAVGDHSTSVKTAVEITQGSIIIYHGTSTSGHWDIVPETDTDTDTWRPIYVGTTELLGNGLSTGAVTFVDGDATKVSTNGSSIKYSHEDTSSVSNITKTARQYIDGIEFDNYGHVTKVTVGSEQDQNATGGETAGTLEFISKAELSKNSDGSIVLETDTKSIDEGAKISVSESSGTITIAHETTNTTAEDSTSTITPAHGDTFTVIDNVKKDAYGHITGVNTKTVTLPEVPYCIDTNDDTDTRYDISASVNSAAAGKTSVDVNLNATTHDLLAGTSISAGTDSLTLEALSDVDTPGNGFQVQFNNDNKITLTGKATDELLGLIKAFASLTDAQATAVGTAVKSYSGTSNDRLYGVNVLPNGKAFVEVPWTDSHGPVGDANKAVDLYAFGTDSYGHVSNAVTVQVIDGNVD